MSLESRFWSKVDRREPQDCWPWTGAINQHGYGVMRPEGRRSGPTVKAHRVSLALAGVDPDGWCVLHRCDNRRCVNPAHLMLGTKADNTHDMLAKQRGLIGERNGHAKLTGAQASEIRRRRLTGEGRDLLATEFNVSGATVTRIANGEGWRHVS